MEKLTLSRDDFIEYVLTHTEEEYIFRVYALDRKDEEEPVPYMLVGANRPIPPKT